MIEAHDKLVDKISKVAENDKELAKRLSKQKDEVLAQMSNEEINELLKRPYPAQYKMKLKKYLKK